MEAKTLKRYHGKSVASLKITAQKWFNLFIRLRDTDENGFGRCISSGQPLQVPSDKAQAGHFYPAGHYSILRFNEDNVHLQGKSDNYFKSGNLNEYRKNLITKIGQDRVQVLDDVADFSKRQVFKWDRFELIEIIEKYKAKAKELQKTKNIKS